MINEERADYDKKKIVCVEIATGKLLSFYRDTIVYAVDGCTHITGLKTANGNYISVNKE